MLNIANAQQYLQKKCWISFLARMADAIVLSNVVPVDGAGAQSRHPLTLAETFQRSLTPPKAIPPSIPSTPLLPPTRKLRPPHLAISQKEGSSQHFLFSTSILIIIRINPVMFHKRSYLEGKSGVSGGVSKSPLFVRFDSSVADRSCKPILKTAR